MVVVRTRRVYIDFFEQWRVLQFLSQYALCSRTPANIAHADKQYVELVRIH